ncbi:hypothetical protein Tco_0527222 [Tanacetum coccineum]
MWGLCDPTPSSRTYSKSPSSWHLSLALNPIFYDHVSFHITYEIDRAADGKLRDKNAEESWESIEEPSLTTKRAK